DERHEAVAAAGERLTPAILSDEPPGGKAAGNGNGHAAVVAGGFPPVAAVAVAQAPPAIAAARIAGEKPVEKEAAASSLYADADGRLHPRGAPSLIPPTWRTALGALRRNKMRSALTALGVIIGVGAVIAMTEIGEGSKAAVQKTIASMGADNLLVLPG